jgi:hypothetical protein
MDADQASVGPAVRKVFQFVHVGVSSRIALCSTPDRLPGTGRCHMHYAPGSKLLSSHIICPED